MGYTPSGFADLPRRDKAIVIAAIESVLDAAKEYRKGLERKPAGRNKIRRVRKR